MRSTLAASIACCTGRELGDEPIAWHELGLLDDPADERPHIGHLELGCDDAAGESIHVEQVRHETLETTGVAGDPAGEVARIGLVQLHVAALERDRETEDRSQRRAEVV